MGTCGEEVVLISLQKIQNVFLNTFTFPFFEAMGTEDKNFEKGVEQELNNL
jgi:hypothetical protein